MRQIITPESLIKQFASLGPFNLLLICDLFSQGQKEDFDGLSSVLRSAGAPDPMIEGIESLKDAFALMSETEKAALRLRMDQALFQYFNQSLTKLL